MDVTVTKEMIEAIRQGAQSMRDQAFDLENQPESKEKNGVGAILRRRTERLRQSSDLLDGFVKRTSEQMKDEQRD